MISGQVDRLRTAAQTYRRLGNHSAEGMLLEAADTICELQTENAKLRELVRDMYHCSDPCNDCPHYNGSNSGFYCGLGIGWKARRMRELGVDE